MSKRLFVFFSVCFLSTGVRAHKKTAHYPLTVKASGRVLKVVSRDHSKGESANNTPTVATKKMPSGILSFSVEPEKKLVAVACGLSGLVVVDAINPRMLKSLAGASGMGVVTKVQWLGSFVMVRVGRYGVRLFRFHRNKGLSPVDAFVYMERWKTETKRVRRISRVGVKELVVGSRRKKKLQTLSLKYIPARRKLLLKRHLVPLPMTKVGKKFSQKAPIKKLKSLPKSLPKTLLKSLPH